MPCGRAVRWEYLIHLPDVKLNLIPMEKLFKLKPLEKQSFMQKMFNRQPAANAIIEMNNLLAEKALNDLAIQDYEKIKSKYGFNITRVYNTELCEIYRTVLKHYSSDSKLTPTEVNELKNLQQFLNLSDQVVAEIHKEITSKIFHKEVESSIKDGVLTDAEDKALDALASALQIPEEIAQQISADTRSQHVNELLNRIVKDQRISPEEENELMSTSKSLNVELIYKGESKEVLQRYKHYWRLENEDLPIIDVGLNLGKNEVAHYETDAEWFVGSSYDKGTVYITNKRVIFDGEEKNSNIKHEKILTVFRYSNGVCIEKDSGKSPEIKTDCDPEEFYIIMKRLTNQ